MSDTETTIPTLPAHARVIAVTAGRGGVGATSLVANLAVALLREGERVVVVDAEVGLRNLDTALGLDGPGDTHLRSVGRIPRWPGLSFVGLDPRSESLLTDTVRALRDSGARVLIDAPRAGAPGFEASVRASDAVLLALTPDAGCLRDTEDALNALAELGDAWLVVSRWREAARNPHPGALTLAQVRDALATPVLGVVPDDPRVVDGHNAGAPVAGGGSGPAARAYAMLAQRVLGRPVADAPVDAPAAWYDVRRWIGLGA
jgi:septum site-determining protein MinD